MCREFHGEELQSTEDWGELVLFEQSTQDETTGVPSDEPDPSKEDPGQGSSPQASVNPAPSPHFYAEPLNMVVPETNSNSEEDADDLAYVSFIRARNKSVAAPESTPKRPITRLQQREAWESTLKKSQRSKRKKRLVKDGKVVHEKVVPVVNVDEEAEEEPSSLTHKFSKQKHSHSQSIRHTSTHAEGPSKSANATSSEKLVKISGDKTVKESGDASDNEKVEKSGELVQKKSMEKGKSVRKSVKREMDDDEEPGSIKKAKVSESPSSEKRKLRNQKVLWARTFASNILVFAGMRQLMDICDSQQWTNLFRNEVPKVYEEVVRSFYTSLFTVEGDQICVLINGVDIVMDSALLGSILDVPAEGLSSAQGSCTSNFRNVIVKDKAIQHGE
ncbi:PREDICTED: uncharacterized protein LOC109232258 [Nicotiana attenuata]|uniref:uncharacterized protein LOC109232258 n=1 Tax=Nicotiana attenuata TaxID=49451 RepID=UPI000905C204|nr:PREDICTED: uncharacterized protein LOC109232258 [Nicotiana attenuata]XP_019253501.1 PREDICTED: uncharacterized protein LOC109232258 [Nicotiana attenuata]XP_019253502.1 PREDICTED: uncharacterized protein LOC109232258 [Nicotiana attenuata]